MGEDTNAAATTTADGTQKRKESTPPDGYVCRLCSTPGHWIQVCPTKKTGDKKRKRTNNPDHVYQEGKDPSPEDIEKAKQMQAIPPPKCFCGVPSRLNMVKRSKAGGDASRAIGKYFFFCSKKRDDETQCRFARPVEMELNKKKKIDSRMSKKKSGGGGDNDDDGGKKKKDKKGGDVDKSKHVCKFFAKTGSCKKGIKCEFSHAVGGDTSKTKAPLKAWEKKKVVEMKGDKDDESSDDSSSSSDDSGGAKKGGADAQKNDDSSSDSDDSSSSDDSD